jgi:hypothetical protein
LAWLCLIFCFFCYGIAWFSCIAKGENLGQTLLDFSHFSRFFAIVLPM